MISPMFWNKKTCQPSVLHKAKITAKPWGALKALQPEIRSGKPITSPSQNGGEVLQAWQSYAGLCNKEQLWRRYNKNKSELRFLLLLIRTKANCLSPRWAFSAQTVNVKGSGFVLRHLKKNVRKKQFVGRIFGCIIVTIAQFRCCYAKSAIDNIEIIDTMLTKLTVFQIWPVIETAITSL